MNSLILDNKFNCSVENLFKWHKNELAIERLTPPWDNIKIVRKETQTDSYINSGKVLLNQQVFPFINLKWEIKHKNYSENNSFDDFAIKSPFRSWYHKHLFDPIDSNTSKLTDDMSFDLWLNNESFAKYIKSRIIKSFKYRYKILAFDLSLQNRINHFNEYILVTGGTGNIGKHLVPHLNSIGYKVILLKYDNKANNEYIGNNVFENSELIILPWNPYNDKTIIFPEEIAKKINHVINLSGETILGLWTKKKMKTIQNSRLVSTRSLCNLIDSNNIKLISSIHSSAIGIYGSSSDSIISEDSLPGTGFLAETTKNWEIEQNKFKRFSERNINLRIGAVLLYNGGFLKPLLIPNILRIGVSFNNHENYLSWIGIEDLTRIVSFALRSSTLNGPVNAVAPNPLTNNEFFKVLNNKFKTKFTVNFPVFLPKLVSKELTKEIIMANQRVFPCKLTDSHFKYFSNNLSDTLDNTFGF